MRKIFFAMAALALLALLAGCKQTARTETETTEAKPIDEIQPVKETPELMDTVKTLPEEPLFDIVTSFGTITVKLYKNTPKHRDNFAKLAMAGYYDNLLFHRVINGFMIQGGDPLTKYPEASDRFGTGGPGYTVPAEILPEYNHKKGALAAARIGDTANPMRESSGSQFYIVQNPQTCAQLDGAYTVYGETVSGIEVIDKIAAVKTLPNDRPAEDVRIIKVKLHE
ncbi:MAG: peptidylprolyl isomerase [Bacteroidales bacterium]|nr:peptidylprolyl isomerase [Bacteroidales bacterium]